MTEERARRMNPFQKPKSLWYKSTKLIHLRGDNVSNNNLATQSKPESNPLLSESTEIKDALTASQNETSPVTSMSPTDNSSQLRLLQQSPSVATLKQQIPSKDQVQLFSTSSLNSQTSFEQQRRQEGDASHWLPFEKAQSQQPRSLLVSNQQQQPEYQQQSSMQQPNATRAPIAAAQTLEESNANSHPSDVSFRNSNGLQTQGPCTPVSHSPTLNHMHTIPPSMPNYSVTPQSSIPNSSNVPPPSAHNRPDTPKPDLSDTSQPIDLRTPTTILRACQQDLENQQAPLGHTQRMVLLDALITYQNSQLTRQRTCSRKRSRKRPELSIGEFVKLYVRQDEYYESTRVPQNKDRTICCVCEEPARGEHYGRITCEGCKGFFKRTVQNYDEHPCTSSTKSCNIARGNRNSCQFCRFKTCLLKGMSPYAVRKNHAPGGRNKSDVYKPIDFDESEPKQPRLEES